MPRKPQPNSQARQRAVDWLREDTSVSDEEKIAWLHSLTGADARKHNSTDNTPLTPDWLSSKFQAEANRRQRQQVQAGARRYALLLILAIALIVSLATLVVNYIA